MDDPREHPDSLTRTVVRQVRSEWRRPVVYAWRWRRVMLFTELTTRTGHRLHRVHYPRIRRVRADGWRDRVSSASRQQKRARSPYGVSSCCAAGGGQ